MYANEEEGPDINGARENSLCIPFLPKNAHKKFIAPYFSLKSILKNGQNQYIIIKTRLKFDTLDISSAPQTA